MKKIKILIFAAVILALLVPMAAYAEGSWYCDVTAEGGGSGTWYDPWSCALEGEIDEIVKDRIGALYGGGFLYEILDEGYILHEIGLVDGEGEGEGEGEAAYGLLSSTEFDGYPPGAGIEDIPMPMILAAVALGGAALVLAGWLLRRKSLTN